MKKYETEFSYILLALIIVLYFTNCEAKAATYAFSCEYGQTDLIFVADSKGFPVIKTIYYSDEYIIDVKLENKTDGLADGVIVEKRLDKIEKYNVECVYSHQ